MKRREFITTLGGAAAWPLVGHEIAAERPLIGYLAGGRQAVVADLVSAFQQGLRKAGYTEGANCEIDPRHDRTDWRSRDGALS